MTKVIDYFGTGKDGGEYSFLSNFWHTERWSVEHLYQAAKTDHPGYAAAILNSPTPGAAKKLGREAPMVEGWDDHKIHVMRSLLRLKFLPGSLLAKKLLATEDAVLIEGNWWGDTFWGEVNGVGENWLGRLLMETREMLKIADKS